MKDKKPEVGGVDTGNTPSKFKLPAYEATNTEGKATGRTTKTPMKGFPQTNVSPYAKG